MNEKYGIKYQAMKGGRLVVKERTFRSSGARRDFLDRIETSGEMVALVSTSIWPAAWKSEKGAI